MVSSPALRSFRKLEPMAIWLHAVIPMQLPSAKKPTMFAIDVP